MPVPITTPFKRQIQLYELDTPVNITFHKHGLEMGLAVQGHKIKMFVRWNDVANVLTVPSDAPSIFVGHSFKYLKFLADRLTKKAKALEAKKVKKA